MRTTTNFRRATFRREDAVRCCAPLLQNETRKKLLCLSPKVFFTFARVWCSFDRRLWAEESVRRIGHHARPLVWYHVDVPHYRRTINHVLPLGSVSARRTKATYKRRSPRVPRFSTRCLVSSFAFFVVPRRQNPHIHHTSNELKRFLPEGVRYNQTNRPSPHASCNGKKPWHAYVFGFWDHTGQASPASLSLSSGAISSRGRRCFRGKVLPHRPDILLITRSIACSRKAGALFVCRKKPRQTWRFAARRPIGAEKFDSFFQLESPFARTQQRLDAFPPVCTHTGAGW